ncbi:MAG: hypothetical protein AB8B93_06670 [Pseudomonadales bacterium]
MTTDSAPTDLSPTSKRYGSHASIVAGFRRFVSARTRGHLLVANALTRQATARRAPDATS